MNQSNLEVALTKECCPACLKAMDGAIVMNKTLNKSQAKKVEEMHGQIVGFADHFCDECQGYAEMGIILVTIDKKKTDDPKNPYRTGGFFVVKEDYIKRLMQDTEMLLLQILAKRMTFIEHELAVNLGLFDHANS